MKKNRSLWIGLVLALFCVLLLPAGAHAANKKAVKKLGKSRTYTIDLNGGKAEKVKYTIREVKVDSFGNTCHQFSLYINGKLAYKRKMPSLGIVTSVYLADIKTSDRYKEIVVNYAGSFSDWYFFILRYTADGKVKAYTKQTGIIGGGRTSLDGTRKVFDGKGVFYAEAETPFYSQTFGCYYALMPACLSNNKITYKKASYYVMSGVAGYVNVVFGGDYYVLARPMTLYTTSSRKKESAILPAGTEFTPKYVSVAGQQTVTENDWTSTYTNLAVKIKTKDGNTGWLYFPGMSEEQYLTNRPEWG